MSNRIMSDCFFNLVMSNTRFSLKFASGIFAMFLSFGFNAAKKTKACAELKHR